MKNDDDPEVALPSAHLMQNFFNQRVDLERTDIVRRKYAIHRWAGMGEDVTEAERLLKLAEKRLCRLLVQRQKAFAVLKWEAT